MKNMHFPTVYIFLIISVDSIFYQANKKKEKQFWKSILQTHFFWVYVVSRKNDGLHTISYFSIKKNYANDINIKFKNRPRNIEYSVMVPSLYSTNRLNRNTKMGGTLSDKSLTNCCSMRLYAGGCWFCCIVCTSQFDIYWAFMVNCGCGIKTWLLIWYFFLDRQMMVKDISDVKWRNLIQTNVFTTQRHDYF